MTTKKIVSMLTTCLMCIVLSGCFVSLGLPDVPQGLTPKETVELFFQYWEEKNEGGMQSLLVEKRRESQTDLLFGQGWTAGLISVTLHKIEDSHEDLPEEWSDMSDNYSAVDVEYEVHYERSVQHYRDVAEYYIWRFYLSKNPEDGSWMICNWESNGA